MNAAGITIIVQLDDDGRIASVQHVITGELALVDAANVCRATANRIDREWIRTEQEAETDGSPTEPQL